MVKISSYKEFKESKSSIKYKKISSNELETVINGRKFEILGDSKDDYYSVHGSTKEEVMKYQFELDSFKVSKTNVGRFTKLRDAKKFIELIVRNI